MGEFKKSSHVEHARLLNARYLNEVTITHILIIKENNIRFKIPYIDRMTGTLEYKRKQLKKQLSHEFDLYYISNLLK